MEAVKKYLEKGEENAATIDGLPLRFFERLITKGLRVDLIETGRIICSFTVPPRLLNAGNFLHGGATATLVDLVGSAVIFTVGAPFTGVSVEINVSYLDAAYPGFYNIEEELLLVTVGLYNEDLRIRPNEEKMTGNFERKCYWPDDDLCIDQKGGR